MQNYIEQIARLILRGVSVGQIVLKNCERLAGAVQVPFVQSVPDGEKVQGAPGNLKRRKVSDAAKRRFLGQRAQGIECLFCRVQIARLEG